MFAFYGDVGNNNSGYSPLVSRLGYELRASTPITPWLEGGLYALHGRLGVNERSSTRNLNFDSRITIGGFQFRYNFHQFLHPGRPVEPYISFGFESVEFLTKTDLHDGQGRFYNYWSDGSIRDLPEDSPNAEMAQVIQRDYVYESDVRELNADGFGKYPERTWAIPVGVGARMDIGGGFDLRVGTTMHFTLTDLVDGVTDESTGSRAGRAGNDNFLFTSVSIGYVIPMERKARKKKLTPLSTEELDLIVLMGDEDGDGVPDISDDCPGTPAGVSVDLKGCPLDRDNDGVPDHEDDEPDSAPGAFVDARGVTLTDEDHLQAYMAWKDSLDATMEYTRVESFGPGSKPRVVTPRRVYVVKVGSQVEGISEDLIQKILSIPDVRTVVQGDTTFYVVGNYASIPEALRRELELRGIGLEGVVMAEENGKLIDLKRPAHDLDTEGSGPGGSTASGQATIRVQLGAFRKKLSENIFTGITDLVTLKGSDGLTRYYTGSFTDVNQAAAHRVAMHLKGFDGAFLVAFRDGKRISLLEAGAKLTGPEELRTVPSGSINKDLIRFRIQVGTFAGNVPIETMGTYIELGNVTPIASADAVRYFYGSYTSRAAADEARKELHYLGLTDAFVVGEVDGRIIPSDEAERLLAEP